MIEVTEDQVLYFRSRRSHLAGPGATDAVQAAIDILGAQSQQPGPGMLALSQRTRTRPSAEEVRSLLYDYDPPYLVRSWGQRETLHIYAPEDWRAIAAAREQWAPAGRRGEMPSAQTLEKAVRAIANKGEATRGDIIDLAPERFVQQALEKHRKYLKTVESARRFAAGRVLWCLSMRGDVCIGNKKGTEQAYAAREVWFPDLPWPEINSSEACQQLTRRYLSFNGPATVQDVAHYFGARVREARAWIDALQADGELVEVRCGDRKALWLRKKDEKALRETPKKSAKDWPVRLLPMWDTYLMGHADKTWTVSEAQEQKLIWRGQAVVAASVIYHGRVIAEWQHDAKAKELAVTVLPLSGWQTSKHMPAVKREANFVAKHMGLQKATVRL